MIRALLDGIALASKHQFDKRRSAVLSPADRTASPVLDQAVTRIDGTVESMADYRGKVLLIANTASKCGFVGQFDQLQGVWKQYRDRGLVVLGFPCDDFLHQEPRGGDEIVSFCRLNYGVDFPLFDKVHVRGAEQHPLFRALTEGTPEAIRGEVRWNFTKFLVDREGRPVGRFEPRVRPDAAEVKLAIEALL
jgi:glutathione peroxidase